MDFSRDFDAYRRYYLSGADYHERKRIRVEYYRRYVEGWRQRNCTACAGSGYYDDGRGTRCGACDGTGKEFFDPCEIVVDKLRALR